MKLSFKKGFTLIRTLANAKNLDNVRSKDAFTLIELLVVISIIGILVALSFVGFMQARKSSRDSQRKANLEQIRSALEIYRTDCKTYPGSLSELTKPPTSLPCAGETYMAEIPSDPVVGQKYGYLKSSVNVYTLCAYLETGGTGDCGNIDCGTNPCNYKTVNP